MYLLSLMSSVVSHLHFLAVIFPRKLLFSVYLSYVVYLECQVTFTAIVGLRLCHRNCENFAITQCGYKPCNSV